MTAPNRQLASSSLIQHIGNHVCQDLLSISITFRMTMSLRMQAVSAIFLCFPVETKRW